jgi:hypothetical protein
MREELSLPARALETETGAQVAMSLGRVSIERGTSEARSELAVGAKSEVAA